MDLYTHPDLYGFISPAAFELQGVQYPRVWWQTASQAEIAALGFVEYVPPEPEPDTPTGVSVDAEHDWRAALGKTFTVTGYGDVALEGSLRTQTVLLALKDAARDMVAAGVTDPVLFLTDRDNIDHNLTPAQMIELVNAGKAFMQALHEAKRAIKALEPIPVDYADDARWP